jgi:hypothetical protein
MSHRFHQRKKKGFLDCVSRHYAQLEQIVRKADASSATRKWFFKKQSNENIESPFLFSGVFVQPIRIANDRPPSSLQNSTMERGRDLIGCTQSSSEKPPFANELTSQLIPSIPTDWFYRAIKQRLCYIEKLVSTTCAVSTVSKSYWTPRQLSEHRTAGQLLSKRTTILNLERWNR